MAVQTRNLAAMRHRLDLQRYEGEVREDPKDWMTCFVKHPVKGFTITFPPHKLEAMREKYGENLIAPKNH